MKQKSILALCGASALASTTLHAANIFWDGTGANWGAVGGWSTGAGVLTDPAAIPGIADVAQFNTTALVGAQTISLAADRTVGGVNFTATAGTKNLQGGGTNRILTLGTSGINVVSGSGAVTIGSAVAGQAVAINMINSQAWINGSTTNTLNIVNGVTRSNGAAVAFSGAGTITATNAFANNSAGIVGTWATIGTGVNAKYATKTGANVLTAVVGTGALTGAALTDTSGLVNYELTAAAGAVASPFSANTIRYTGAADTLAPGATSFKLNGLLNAGTGVLTVGTNTLTIGDDKELVVNAGNAGVTISSIIADNSVINPSILTKTGTNTLTLTGTNSFTGGTNITAGNIFLSNTTGNALQGPITMSGGGRLVLTGSNQISDTSVITFASGNNSARFNLSNAAGTSYSETIAGIADGPGAAAAFTGNRIVEPATDNTAGSPGILTIDTAGASHTFGGFVRDSAGVLAVGSTLTIVKNGLGSQAFTGSVTYTGNTTVNAGTLKLPGPVNGSAIALQGGTIEFTGGGTRSLLISSTSGAGGVIKSGTGNLIFQGDNTYTGTTTVNGGTLTLDRTGGTIADTGTVSVTTATAILNVNKDDTIANLNLALASTVSGAGTLTVTTLIAPNIGLGSNNIISASLAGNAQLKKTGQGTTTLSAVNSYSGGTVLSGANSKLNISGAGTLGSTSGALSIETASAILDLGATTQTVGSVSAIGTVNNGTLNVSTQLSLGDPLTANAIGTASFNNLTMGGSSTYSFGLNSGTLLADNGTVTGALTLTSGAILDLVQLGTFALGEKFTLFGYTTAGGLTGTFKDTSLVTLADGATFADAGGNWLIDYNDGSAGLNGGTGDTFVTITAVIPEPNVAALLGGLGMLALLRRRRA